MDAATIQAITELTKAISNPFAVSAIALIIVGIVPKIPMLKRFFGDNGNGIEKLQPILTELTKGIEKVSGNDLLHVQKAIDALAKDHTRRMDNFDDKLAKHDKQAGIILEKQKEFSRKQGELCKKMEALCAKQGIVVG